MKSRLKEFRQRITVLDLHDVGVAFDELLDYIEELETRITDLEADLQEIG